VKRCSHLYTVRWSTSTPRSISSSSTSRYDSPQRNYQRTATTITSGGKRKPAKADRAAGAGRGRQDLMLGVLLFGCGHSQRNSALPGLPPIPELSFLLGRQPRPPRCAIRPPPGRDHTILGDASTGRAEDALLHLLTSRSSCGTAGADPVGPSGGGSRCGSSTSARCCNAPASCASPPAIGLNRRSSSSQAAKSQRRTSGNRRAGHSDGHFQTLRDMTEPHQPDRHHHLACRNVTRPAQSR
jgi:hypothetical protein